MASKDKSAIPKAMALGALAGSVMPLALTVAPWMADAEARKSDYARLLDQAYIAKELQEVKGLGEAESRSMASAVSDYVKAAPKAWRDPIVGNFVGQMRDRYARHPGSGYRPLAAPMRTVKGEALTPSDSDKIVGILRKGHDKADFRRIVSNNPGALDHPEFTEGFAPNSQEWVSRASDRRPNPVGMFPYARGEGDEWGDVINKLREKYPELKPPTYGEYFRGALPKQVVRSAKAVLPLALAGAVFGGLSAKKKRDMARRYS